MFEPKCAFINIEKGKFTNMEPQVSKRLNWQFLLDSIDCMRSTEFDRMVFKQPSSLALHEFGSAKFGLPNVIERMCQNSKVESLDISNSTVMVSSVQSIESSRFNAKRLETTNFSPTLYISYHLRPFKLLERPYIV